MKIRIQATDERSPKTNKPLFKLYFDDDYEGTMYECVIDSDNLHITDGVDSHEI